MGARSPGIGARAQATLDLYKLTLERQVSAENKIMQKQNRNRKEKKVYTDSILCTKLTIWTEYTIFTESN
jgi:hypothetical protein